MGLPWHDKEDVDWPTRALTKEDLEEIGDFMKRGMKASKKILDNIWKDSLKNSAESHYTKGSKDGKL